MNKKLLWCLVPIFVLWFFPGFYLMTHEGGHCLTAEQLGAENARLFLGCGLGLDDDKNVTSSGVTVCSAFFYNFIFQAGYCDMAPWEPSTPSGSRWLSASGSFLWIPIQLFTNGYYSRMLSFDNQ